MSDNMHQLAEIERKLAFYKGPEFQSFLEEHVLGRASSLRSMAETESLYSVDGRERALAFLATARELEGIAGTLIEGLESSQRLIVEGLQSGKADRDPFSAANLRKS